MNGQQERVIKRHITMANELENNNGDIIIYQFEDGRIKLNVRLENTTMCLTKDQVAEFYEEARATIIEHILNADKESEIEESKTMRKSEIPFFSTKPTNYYNFNFVISVGYRVNSSEYTLSPVDHRTFG